MGLPEHVPAEYRHTVPVRRRVVRGEALGVRPPVGVVAGCAVVDGGVGRRCQDDDWCESEYHSSEEGERTSSSFAELHARVLPNCRGLTLVDDFLANC